MSQARARTILPSGSKAVLVAADAGQVAPASALSHRLLLLASLQTLKTCPACASAVFSCDVVEGDVFDHVCEVMFDCGARVRLQRDGALRVLDGCRKAIADALLAYVPGLRHATA